MLPISWNGSNGVVHFLVTSARNSLTDCACTPVAISAAAHTTAVNILIVASHLFLLARTARASGLLRSQTMLAPERHAMARRAKIFFAADGIAPIPASTPPSAAHPHLRWRDTARRATLRQP